MNESEFIPKIYRGPFSELNLNSPKINFQKVAKFHEQTIF